MTSPASPLLNPNAITPTARYVTALMAEVKAHTQRLYTALKYGY